MRKQYILYIVVILLSIINIINANNTSALSYSSSVGVGFTFNPTLSVNISPSDLVIPNLTPGTTGNSNIINVSVATNTSYGYTLSAIMNGNNNDLTHTNGTNTFSSIATNADLSSLDNSEDTNIWGYSYKDNTVQTPTWSNYNGLSSSNSVTLLDTNTNNIETGIDSIDFKIAAKAGNAQASGTYTGVINFTAVTKLTPMNLAESYFAAGKTRHNGYYAMQDMTSEICNNTEVIGEGSQTELIDIRDNKVYWATKLADGHCWMTQNLDLDLSHDKPLTSGDTDLNDGSLSGAYSENYKYDPATRTITWTPVNTTRDYANNTGTAWSNNNNTAYSLNPGEWYWNGNDETSECNYLTTTCEDFLQTFYSSTNLHGHLGNYYNWSAAIASDDSRSLIQSTYTDTTNNPQNSICPKNWRLPTISNQGNIENSTSEFARLNGLYNDNNASNDIKLIAAPLYLLRSGNISYGSLYGPGVNGNYWSSTLRSNVDGYSLNFNRTHVYSSENNYGRYRGMSIRCLAK